MRPEPANGPENDEDDLDALYDAEEEWEFAVWEALRADARDLLDPVRTAGMHMSAEVVGAHTGSNASLTIDVTLDLVVTASVRRVVVFVIVDDGMGDVVRYADVALEHPDVPDPETLVRIPGSALQPCSSWGLIEEEEALLFLCLPITDGWVEEMLWPPFMVEGSPTSPGIEELLELWEWLESTGFTSLVGYIQYDEARDVWNGMRGVPGTGRRTI